MRRVQRSALVQYSAAQMFALVDGIESYPEFLPWCGSSEIHSREGDTVEATLSLRRGDISKHFRTRNTASAKEAIDMQLVDGPFRHLSGRWTFAQLGTSGSKVALDIEFEFANPVIDTLFGSFFEDTCNSLVDAFTRRADDVFGRTG
jgi:ribosome-associated toxin RatA of RatAB toxin-antitoxin module